VRILQVVENCKLSWPQTFSGAFRRLVLNTDWLSGNVLAAINVVALRRTWLVPGLVSYCEKQKGELFLKHSF